MTRSNYGVFFFRIPQEHCLINAFDTSTLRFFNQFAQRWPSLDRLICLVSNDFLLRGGVITAILWWAWFRPSNDRLRDRQIILSGAFAGLVSISGTRALVAMLPFRARPIDVPSLHFRPPIGFNQAGLIHWSSFPSDHAVLYFALATIVCLISWRAGILTYCFAFFVVCLPRIYLGLHYPTDILAGEVIGVLAVYIFSRPLLRQPISEPLLHWHDRSPGSFYAFLYLGTFALATNMESLRVYMSFLLELVLGLFHHGH